MSYEKITTLHPVRYIGDKAAKFVDAQAELGLPIRISSEEPFEDMRRIISIMEGTLSSQFQEQFSNKAIESLCQFEKLANENPVLAPDITSAARSLFVSGLLAWLSVSGEIVHIEARRQWHIWGKNSKEIAVGAKLQAIARDLWAADAAEEYRLRDAAAATLDDYIAKNPDAERLSVETVVKWIRPVAPAYATKKGRPSTKD